MASINPGFDCRWGGDPLLRCDSDTGGIVVDDSACSVHYLYG